MMFNDLTKINVPFGLLDEATQQALRNHGGPYERYFGGEWKGWEPKWAPDNAYRVRPEPERRTMTLNGGQYWAGFEFSNFDGADDTHRITFDLVGGEPDCEKCPTCGTAKHVDMERIK